MQSFKSYCFSEPTIITTPKRLLHGATTNLTPTVHPPCKASNPTASQNQQLLQLLRDCLHGATTNLTATVHSPYKASNPTASQNQQLLQLLRDCLHGATRKPYSYCTPTMQSFKSYYFSGPTMFTWCCRKPYKLLHYFHHSKLQIYHLQQIIYKVM